MREATSMAARPELLSSETSTIPALNPLLDLLFNLLSYEKLRPSS